MAYAFDEMPLTADQEKLWTECGMDKGPRPTGDQTPAQDTNMAVEDFRYLCRLEGLDPLPSRAEIRALFLAD